MIDPQGENLLFSLVVRGGAAAVALLFLFWLIFRLAGPELFRRLPFGRRAAKATVGTGFVAIFCVVLYTAFQSSGPRLTVSDHSYESEPYFGPGATRDVQNLDPNRMTDKQRSEFNRRMFEENALKDAK